MKLFVWSEYYSTDMGDHIFPVEKYYLIRRRSLEQRVATQDEFLEPELPSDHDLEIVHTRSHIRRLKRLSGSPAGMDNGENPINESVYNASKLSCDATYKASILAIQNGIAMHLGGGFHHAFPNREEGFCYFNDIAYAIQKLLAEKKVSKVMVIDCDVHQGNGTAFIFQNNPQVFTFSIHQEDNYPIKEVSDVDIGLQSWENINDDRYLEKLRVLERLIPEFASDLIIYEAGADPYEHDKLGGFKLTKKGLIDRDEYVIGLARNYDIPIAIVLGGGYAHDVSDVVDIHVNTMKVVKKFANS